MICRTIKTFLQGPPPQDSDVTSSPTPFSSSRLPKFDSGSCSPKSGQRRRYLSSMHSRKTQNFLADKIHEETPVPFGSQELLVSRPHSFAACQPSPPVFSLHRPPPIFFILPIDCHLFIRSVSRDYIFSLFCQFFASAFHFSSIPPIFILYWLFLAPHCRFSASITYFLPHVLPRPLIFLPYLPPILTPRITYFNITDTFPRPFQPTSPIGSNFCTHSQLEITLRALI